MQKSYIVRLTLQERGSLQALARHGRAHARKLFCTPASCSRPTPRRRDPPGPTSGSPTTPCRPAPLPRLPRAQALLGGGFGGGADAQEARQAQEEARAGRGRAEAHLVALACSEPPEGREGWTLRLLADRMVELGHVEGVSYETVRRTLKKTRSSPTSSRRSG